MQLDPLASWRYPTTRRRSAPLPRLLAAAAAVLVRVAATTQAVQPAAVIRPPLHPLAYHRVVETAANAPPDETPPATPVPTS